VEEEVAGGMKKLGLDPANIKYAIVSHAHPDHDGGAKFLQNHYGTQAIMSPADWAVLDKRTVTAALYGSGTAQPQYGIQERLQLWTLHRRHAKVLPAQNPVGVTWLGVVIPTGPDPKDLANMM
jgi:glyoxylase-like metal-dependent hydrolase (beta-lactamase superfamily II)